MVVYCYTNNYFPMNTSALDFLNDKSLRYILLNNFWLHKWVKKHYKFRKTTTMLLLMLYELKRPIISSEWSWLNSNYSFSNSASDIMLLENLGMIRKTKVMIDDAEKIKKRGRKSIKSMQEKLVHAYRYEITQYGISVADEIRKNIQIRVDNFTITIMESMRKY